MTPSGSVEITVACVKIDGNEVNWGDQVTGGTDLAKQREFIIGWAKDVTPGEIGGYATNFPGNPDPCSAATLAWDGEGIVTAGDLVVN